MFVWLIRYNRFCSYLHRQREMYFICDWFKKYVTKCVNLSNSNDSHFFDCLLFSLCVLALHISLRSPFSFSCFALILCFWMISFAKEKHRTFTYKCTILCNTFLAILLSAINSHSDNIGLYADTNWISQADIDTIPKKSILLRLLGVALRKLCSILSKINCAFEEMDQSPPLFRDEMSVCLSISFWFWSFPALSIEAVNSLSCDVLSPCLLR